MEEIHLVGYCPCARQVDMKWSISTVQDMAMTQDYKVKIRFASNLDLL